MGKKGCIFCDHEGLCRENQLAWVKYDKYPVSPGHSLIITKRHIESFFDTTPEERQAINELLEETKKLLDQQYKPDGYNIGINCGEAAGQSIMHMHVHLIPRYQGDIDNPKGGVRGVIPAKRIYLSRSCHYCVGSPVSGRPVSPVYIGQ